MVSAAYIFVYVYVYVYTYATSCKFPDRACHSFGHSLIYVYVYLYIYIYIGIYYDLCAFISFLGHLFHLFVYVEEKVYWVACMYMHTG